MKKIKNKKTTTKTTHKKDRAVFLGSRFDQIYNLIYHKQ